MAVSLKLFLLSLILAGCARPPQPLNDGPLIEDMLGREVQLPGKIDRIIGLRAGALRLLLYMDAADLVAGIEEPERRVPRTYMEAYPGLRKLPVTGPIMGGDAELILKADPDVIFMSYTTRGDADALQKKTGIPVIAIECPEMATEREVLFDSFRLIGKVLNKQSRADSLIAYINRSITILDERTSDIADCQRPSVYIGGVSYSSSYGISSTQPYYPPFIFTNSKNVASGIDSRLISHIRGTFIDKEQLLVWNPDYIFVDQSGSDLVENDLDENSFLFSRLDAVMNNRVFKVYPYNNYAVNYELVMVNAWNIGKILYPERFEDIVIADKSEEILEVFLGEGQEHVGKTLFDE